MKSLSLILGMLLLLCRVGECGFREATLYQLAGKQKPIVIVLPVIDNTSGNTLSWDLSREFTDEIRKRVYDSKRLYLLPDAGNLEIAKLLSTPNPQAIPSVAISDLGAAEFAVVAEIIEQGEEKYGVGRTKKEHSQDAAGSVFSLALRVRVIDVRQQTPQVILQEVLDQDYVISRAYMHTDYSKAPWGTQAFATTPMGMAHNRLVRSLMARVEAYIEAVK